MRSCAPAPVSEGGASGDEGSDSTALWTGGTPCAIGVGRIASGERAIVAAATDSSGNSLLWPQTCDGVVMRAPGVAAS